MRGYDGRLVGIFGTLIIHLIAGIIFMLFKVGSLKKENHELFTMELQPVEMTEPPKEKVPEERVTTAEKVVQGDKELMNIARNLANKSEQKINAQDYIDMVKEEMIKNGQLGRDNYIDEQKRMKEDGGNNENVSLDQDKLTQKEPEKPKASQQLAANFKGPTRIYYDLAGRTHTYLPIPIYKCEGSGKVSLAIEVAQKGEVISAKVIEGESTTNDPCLIETAVSTALLSRFNPDINSPKAQEGTLTYHFVAQ
jgi:hypothetical protein